MAGYVVLKDHFIMVEKTIKSVVIVAILEWKQSEETWDVEHQRFLATLAKSHLQVVVY
jgi:hypothetical protein